MLLGDNDLVNEPEFEDTSRNRKLPQSFAASEFNPRRSDYMTIKPPLVNLPEMIPVQYLKDPDSSPFNHTPKASNQDNLKISPGNQLNIPKKISNLFFGNVPDGQYSSFCEEKYHVSKEPIQPLQLSPMNSQLKLTPRLSNKESNAFIIKGGEVMYFNKYPPQPNYRKLQPVVNFRLSDQGVKQPKSFIQPLLISYSQQSKEGARKPTMSTGIKVHKSDGPLIGRDNLDPSGKEEIEELDRAVIDILETESLKNDGEAKQVFDEENLDKLLGIDRNEGKDRRSQLGDFLFNAPFINEYRKSAYESAFATPNQRQNQLTPRLPPPSQEQQKEPKSAYHTQSASKSGVFTSLKEDIRFLNSPPPKHHKWPSQASQPTSNFNQLVPINLDASNQNNQQQDLVPANEHQDEGGSVASTPPARNMLVGGGVTTKLNRSKA